MPLQSLLLLALKGLLPERVSWLSEAIVDLLEGIPDIVGIKGKLDETSKEQIKELVADILEEIPEVNQIEAQQLADAIVVITDKILRAIDKKRMIKSRRKRRVQNA